MPASGHQDHTTSPSASTPFVKGASRVHRIPARVGDVAQRPSCRVGTGRVINLICPTRPAEYFYHHDWTGKISLIGLKNFRFTRTRFEAECACCPITIPAVVPANQRVRLLPARWQARGPITTNVFCQATLEPSRCNNAHRWLWVPGRAREARLPGTTWAPQPLGGINGCTISANAGKPSQRAACADSAG